MWRAVLALILLVACTEPVSLPQYLPSSLYAQWWQDAAICVGRSADLRRVEWFFVERIDGAPHAVGRWRSPHEIEIINLHRENKRVVQHEMIHDLLQAGNEAHDHLCFALPHR